MRNRIVLLIMALLAITACNKASGGLSPDGYANQGTKPASKNAALSSYEQKERLEDAGKALIDELDVDNWKATADFVKALGDHFEELAMESDESFEAIEYWAEEVEDAMLNIKTRDAKMTFKVVYALSKMPKGRFVEEDGVFEFKEGGSNVQMITNVDGKKVTITLTNGAETKEYELWSEHWKAENDWERRYYDGESYTEWNETVSIKIPAWVNIEVKEGSTRHLNWKASFNVADTNGDGVLELEKDKANINTEIKFGDYTASASETYSASKGVGHGKAGMSVYRGSKMLVTMGVEGDVEIEGDMQDGYKDTEPKTVKAAVDVMGLVQAKGNIDYPKYKYFIDKVDPYASEEAFERSVQDLESCVDIAIYYDRKAGRQAWLGFEPMYNDYYGNRYYDPVVRFADETSYGLGEFFQAKDFSSLLDAMEDWVDSLEYYFSSFD